MKIFRINAAFFLFLILLPNSAFSITQEDFKKGTDLNESAIKKLRSGNIDGAEQDLLQALVYSGQSPKIRKNLGVVYYEKGVKAQNVKKDFNEAKRYLSMALDIEPQNDRYKKAYAAALFFEANIRAKEGRNDEAMRLYKQAAELDPQNSAAWGHASNYAWSNQKINQAQDYLDRAKALNPSDKNIKILEDRMKQAGTESHLERQESEHFILVADPQYLKNLGGHNVLYDLEQAYNSVSYKLSLYPKHKIPVVFYPVKDFRNHWNLPARVSAFYDGKLRIPYYDNNTPVNVLKPVLMHELTHAFISTVTDKPIPQWLNEGLAQWVEGKEIDRKAKDALMIYETTKRSPPIQMLDSILAGKKNSANNTEMTLAYMKSFSLVQYLIQQHGIWTIMKVIHEYPNYNSFDEICRKFFNENIESVQKSWLQWFERS